LSRNYAATGLGSGAFACVSPESRLMRLAGSFGATASVTRERMRQIAAKRDEEDVKRR